MCIREFKMRERINLMIIKLDRFIDIFEFWIHLWLNKINDLFFSVSKTVNLDYFMSYSDHIFFVSQTGKIQFFFG